MFAVLHISDFALHAVIRTEQSVADKPAALFSGTSKKSVVLAANPAARRLGVELGMSAPQAVARCPTLVIRSPRSAAEADARAALLAIGFTLSPSIEDTAPGICTIDVSKRPPEKVAASVQSAALELRGLGLPATAGLARTPLLALYAARADRADPADADSRHLLGESRAAYSSAADQRSPASFGASVPSEVCIVSDEKTFLASL